jgi:hypothetical protein
MSFGGMNKFVLFAALTVTPIASAQTVKVHLDAPPRVVLEEDAYMRWVPICSAPCDRQLDVRGIYRIGGRDVKRQRIDITPKPGKSALDIHVEPGSRAVNIAGKVVLPLGAAATTIGLFIGFLSGANDWRIAGNGLVIGGSVMALVGLALVGASQTTITF